MAEAAFPQWKMESDEREWKEKGRGKLHHTKSPFHHHYHQQFHSYTRDVTFQTKRINSMSSPLKGWGWLRKDLWVLVDAHDAADGVGVDDDDDEANDDNS